MHNLSPNRWEPKAMREQPAPEEDLFRACLPPFSLPPPFLPFAFFLCRHILTRTCFSALLQAFPLYFKPFRICHSSWQDLPLCVPSRTFLAIQASYQPAYGAGAGFNYWLLPLYPALSLSVSQECGGSLVARKSRNGVC